MLRSRLRPLGCHVGLAFATSRFQETLSLGLTWCIGSTCRFIVNGVGCVTLGIFLRFDLSLLLLLPLLDLLL